MKLIEDVITDTELLRARTVYVEGFAFSSLGNVGSAANIFDAIIIRSPETAQSFSPKYGCSRKTLQEHIEFINKHQLKKAIVIADNICFLKMCPSLKYLRIIPADSSTEFDYSPIYSLRQLAGLNCATEYGTHSSRKTIVDYQYVPHVLDLDIAGQGHLNLSKQTSIRRLSISRVSAKNLFDIASAPTIQELSITQCRISTIAGISQFPHISKLVLSYNRSLSDMREVEACADSLQFLSIDSCARITDFSFLFKLRNLEYLDLRGGNALTDLSFLSKMKGLKCFTFSMNILNGDLSPCLSIPRVYSLKNRKHYNLSDNDLPKIEV